VPPASGVALGMTLSLRARFILYLVVVHTAAGAAGVLLIAQQAQWGWILLLEAILVFSFAFGVVLVSRLVRALAFVGDSAQFLDDGEYTTRFREVGQPEVDRLIGLYNRMIDRLRRERQRVEEQHYFLSRILDVSPAGIVVLDFDGRIELANPAAARLLQAEGDTLRGRLPAGCGVPLLDEAAGLAPGESRVCAVPVGRRLRVLRGTFTDRGFPRTFFLLEELTEELRRSERAAYEKLIRMMSHEVNNSVGASASLLHSAQAYGHQLPPDDRADFERALQIAVDRLGQLNTFMRSFADVVRVPQPMRQPTDLVAILRNLEDLTRAERDKRRIAWRTAAAEVPPLPLDRAQMEQALLNVVKNAIEAIGEDGTIAVGVARDGSRITLTIDDTGPEIPDGVRQQLFTPFFTTKPAGQGVGLTMVQEILQNHGAAYSLDRAPGGPTRFTVVFT
jgi:two-component system, NtrC family, nitrogen regulation sensor histidine kinase NtrY